jgi:hypothetical protein
LLEGTERTRSLGEVGSNKFFKFWFIEGQFYSGLFENREYPVKAWRFLLLSLAFGCGWRAES